MPKSVQLEDLPANVRAALDLLKVRRPNAVVSRDVTQRDDDGIFQIDVILPPVIDENGHPNEIEITLSIDDQYPYSEVEINLKKPKICGEKHQRLEDGKLCLRSDIRQCLAEDKILKSVDNARQWVEDALNGRLGADGDHYEIPDFEHGRKTVAQTGFRLMYRADKRRLDEIWSHYIGESGVAELLKLDADNVFAFVSATNATGATIFKDDDWKLHCRNEYKTKRAIWCFVDDIVYENHRPPVTWKELWELLESSGCGGAYEMVRKEWARSDDELAYLLIGCPIPDVYGGENVSCFWRAVAFETFQACKRHIRTKSCKKLKPLRSWRISEPEAGEGVKWCPSENLSYIDLTSRWVFSQPLENSSVAIVGCGAVGSSLADKLARGGVSDFLMIDPERLEYGNLSRHLLSGNVVGAGKAEELGRWLEMYTPFKMANWLNVRLPLCDAQRPFTERILGQDLVLECTGDGVSSAWLSRLTREKSKRMVRLFLNSDATYLTGVFSGRNVSCRRVELAFCSDLGRRSVEAERQGLVIEDYKERPVSVRTPGCWSATYPGSWIDIEAMVGCLVKKLEAEVNEGWKCDGRVVVFKSLNPALVGSAVQCVWDERYR